MIELGVCHLCDAQAVHECRQCHRPVCDEHLVPLAAELQADFGSDACRRCAASTIDDLSHGEGQWARKRSRDLAHLTCTVCGRQFEQALPQCGQCGRHVCPDHSLRYRRKFKFGATGHDEEAWYWDYELRCHEHRLNPVAARLKGWREAPPD